MLKPCERGEGGQLMPAANLCRIAVNSFNSLLQNIHSVKYSCLTKIDGQNKRRRNVCSCINIIN